VNLKDNLSETSAESNEQVERQETGDGVHESKVHEVFNSKAKSSLCRNFMERGNCPYGTKCQFAHGPSELKCNSDQQMSYKTRPCHAFDKKGCCSYGSRCNFLHRTHPSHRNSNSSIKLRDIIYEIRGSRIVELLSSQ
jgi:hypothetical protein